MSCFQATISNWTSLKTQNKTGLQLPPFSQKAIYPFDVTTHPRWTLGGTIWCEFKGDSTQSSIHFIVSLTPHWLLKHRTRTEWTTQCFCSSNVIPRPPALEGRWHTSTQLQGPQRQWQLGGSSFPVLSAVPTALQRQPTGSSQPNRGTAITLIMHRRKRRLWDDFPKVTQAPKVLEP